MIATAFPAIQPMPIAALTPMVEWGPDERTIYADLDANGMRNPVLAYRKGYDAFRAEHTKLHKRGTFVRVDGDDVLLVKWGNQRIQWAKLRGYTHIATVVCPSQVACLQWLRRYRDA